MTVGVTGGAATVRCMTFNLSERAKRMSALVLHVSLDATREVVAARLTEITGTNGGDWLAGPVTVVPFDLYAARAVQAGRVLTCTPGNVSRAVVAFLAADSKLPELERAAPPACERATSGVQLALVS